MARGLAAAPAGTVVGLTPVALPAPRPMQPRSIDQSADTLDADIVRRINGGETDAFELLLERHGTHVQRVVSRHVPPAAVAEVSHDAMVAAFLSLSGWEPTHALERWLARIALRTCANHWRTRGGPAWQQPLDADARTEPATSDPAGDDRELLDWALAQLEPEDRQVLTLVYFEQLDVRECAGVLGWGESKVKVRAHRARARLREILKRILPERGARS